MYWLKLDLRDYLFKVRVTYINFIKHILERFEICIRIGSYYVID